MTRLTFPHWRFTANLESRFFRVANVKNGDEVGRRVVVGNVEFVPFRLQLALRAMREGHNLPLTVLSKATSSMDPRLNIAAYRI